MTYSTRNSFYLRISKSIVLPIYVSRTDVPIGPPLVYLDERHVNWMADKVLQHVLSDLRPYILPKLKAEADSLTGGAAMQKKATVDTHRGDSYQFCYFIRKTEPHSVVIKTRNFRAAPKRSNLKPTAPTTSSKKRGRRKEPAPSDNTKSKKRRIDDRPLIDEEGDTAMTGDSNVSADEAETVADTDVSPMIELEIEEEEEKPKPILGLKYQGFSIYGQCLCVVVEPWPAVRATTVAPLFAKPASSGTSVPRESNAQAQTPLFLPEDPEDTQETLHHAEAPHRSNINQSYLKQILSEQVDVSDDEDDMGGMLEFSQVLHNIGDIRAGAVNDDDDMDGSILFGDADEFKEL